MSKPRRTTAEAFYDVFADFELADQAAALRILNELHRQKIRESKRKPAAEPAEPATATVATNTRLFLDDREIRNVADLDRVGEPAANAALLLDESGDKGPKQ